MNRPLLLGSLLIVVSLATLWGVLSQRNQLAGLRAEQRQLVARLAAKAGGSASAMAVETASAGPGTPSSALVVTPELLRLRSEVTRLDERRRELASVRAQNERLRAELAGRATNETARYWSSPGFLRTSQARMVGYNTPEDTLQSLLWAVHNRDVTNALRAYMPVSAECMQAQLQASPSDFERFWRYEAVAFCMRFVRGDTNPYTGTLRMDGEMFPGLMGHSYWLRQTNGQWKLD